MFEVVTGDLLESKETYLCHQCNCITTRSKFLAEIIFTAFPYADIYSKREKPSQLGTIIIEGDGKSQRYVINLLGQFYPGRKYPDSTFDGTKIRLRHFKSCLEKMEELEGDFAFPWRIGCGAAGGDWDLYFEILEKFEKSINGDVIIYRLDVPKPDHPKLF